MASTAQQFMNWIKSPAGRQYFFSTHFWGPVANWGLPLAALSDVFNKDEEYISGVMSPTLAVYSMIFMRFAWRVIPRNYLLFACHATNAAAQSVQELRYINYWHFGGREKKHPELVAADAAKDASQEIKDAAALVSQDKFSAAGDDLKKAGQDALHAASSGAEALSKKGQEVKAEVESKVKKEIDALKK